MAEWDLPLEVWRNAAKLGAPDPAARAQAEFNSSALPHMLVREAVPNQQGYNSLLKYRHPSSQPPISVSTQPQNGAGSLILSSTWDIL